MQREVRLNNVYIFDSQEAFAIIWINNNKGFYLRTHLCTFMFILNEWDCCKLIEVLWDTVM